MKTRTRTLIRGLIRLSTIAPQLAPGLAQGTVFTYQGRLEEAGTLANGIYDLRFTTYDTAGGGSQQGPMLTNAAAAVSNGLFTVTLDFGAGVFTGPARWLEVAVRTNGGGAFTALTPRQALTPSPYAIYAGGAQTAATVGAGGFSSPAIADGSIAVGDLSPPCSAARFGGWMATRAPEALSAVWTIKPWNCAPTTRPRCACCRG
jgi:hypothetical protein